MYLLDIATSLGRMSQSAPASSSPAADAGRLGTAAIVLAASVVGVPLLTGMLAQAVMHQLNPRDLDLTDTSSYEVEIWVPVILAAVGMIIAIALVFSRLAKVAGTRSVLRYPTLVVQLQVGTTIAVIALFLLTPGMTDL